MSPNESPADLMVVVDVICPWCYVGKRRMEKALTMLGDSARLRVSWLPFQLNPDMPKDGIERREYRIRKFGSWEHSLRLDAQLKDLGKGEGLDFRYDLMNRTPNTFNAHRLIAHARKDNHQNAIVESIMRGYFTEGRDIGDAKILADIAQECGMDRSAAAQFLEGEEAAAEVSHNESAARNAGITGVPAFALNGQIILVGAHPPEAIASAIQNALGAPAVKSAAN